MTAKECILTRRSIRKFKNTPIDHALIDEIVETASYAPSWKHTQITRYVAVEGALKNRIVAEATSAYPNNGEIIASAPMLIVACMVTKRSGFERDGSYSTRRNDGWQMFDVGVASQTFCLAAHEKGLGSVIMGIFDDTKAWNLPVVDEEGRYVGFMSKSKIFNSYREVLVENFSGD